MNPAPRPLSPEKESIVVLGVASTGQSSACRGAANGLASQEMKDHPRT